MNYKLLFDTAVLAGEILIKNGAETYRVEDTMSRILNKSGVETAQVLVIMTGFMVTLDDPSMGHALTEVRRITSRGTNLEKIEKVNRISREFCQDEISLEDAFYKMNILIKEETRQKRNYFAIMMINAGFAIMFGGTIKETAIAALAGLITAVILNLCRKKNVHIFLENMFASVAIAIVVGAVVLMNPGLYDKDLMIISSIMPLVPGAAITNAVFDTLHGDYISGVARTAEAFMIASAVAIGIGLGLIAI